MRHDSNTIIDNNNNNTNNNNEKISSNNSNDDDNITATTATVKQKLQLTLATSISNLHIKKDKTDNHFSKLFLFTFQAVRICFKKSELIFKHYYTIIRPKHIGH